MPSPPVPIPPIIGRPLEAIYRLAVERRNRGFDLGRRVTRLPLPVISVGNLSLGGTGKTPLVMRIVAWLQEAGRRPVIAMRGYRARPGHPSDEHAEYLARFPDLPIVAQADRIAGLRAIIERHAADCIILDDGFQHRFIARDLDLVLIDCSRSPFEDRCLPAGGLREPVGSLRRADAVVLTHAELAPEGSRSALSARIAAVSGRPPIAVSEHEWAELLVQDAGGLDHAEPVSMLSGLRVVMACAIGNPDPFRRGVREAGAAEAAAMIRRDHHDWTPREALELRRLASFHHADAIVTTEKDFTKLRRHSLGGSVVIRPVLRLKFRAGETPLRQSVLDTLART